MTLVTGLVAAAGMTGEASAQLRPPAGGQGIGDYTLHDFAAKWMMQQDDLAEIGRHAEANRTLAPEPANRKRIILFGDSITAHWDLAAQDSAARHFVNRGIGGQNSSQMLLRFNDDVVALKSDTVVILAGTNDLRAYVGPPAELGQSAFARVTRNLTMMADIAAARHIRVVIGLIPPVGADRERIARDPAAIRAINAWIVAFGRERGIPVADYHRVLADPADTLPQRFSSDGIHPNQAGYAAMWPMLEAALKQAERDR